MRSHSLAVEPKHGQRQARMSRLANARGVRDRMNCTESDAELLVRMAAGDREAFACLYDRYAARLLGLLLQFVRDRDAAEDLLQTTFLQIWKQAAKYDAKRSPVEVWMLLIARSRALDHLDKRLPAAKANVQSDAVSNNDPAEAVELREIRGCVGDALMQLPVEQRAAIQLAFYDGLTHVEVAERQAVPLGTVKTRIRLGMNRLRTILETREVT